jgi:hypothetical protein
MGRPPGAKNKPKAVTVDAPEKKTVQTKAKVRVDYAKQAQLEEESDMLHIPPEIVPDGMRYNWKTYSVLGQVQSRRFGRYQTTGWEPVPASRHPGLFTPKGADGFIEYDGLVLMEKPEELCRLTEAREFQKARAQVSAKEQQLRGGDVGTTLDSRHKSALASNKISKTYERIDVPE